MRVLALTTTALALVAAAALVDGPAHATTTTAATVKVVVRPVTAAGYARPAYTVIGEPTNQADCRFADPAPSAVSPNIEACSPTVAGAFACWKSAAVHKVICIRNPRVRKLYRIPRLGAFAPTALAPKAQRAPLSMVLGNGDYCLFRTGGTGAIRQDHPAWVQTYYCNSGKFIWMRPGENHYGVYERYPSWTVIVAGSSGPIVARHVAKAWFVGTYVA